MSYRADATLTSKGQVTVPAGIRERLAIKPGDQLRFDLAGSGELTVTPLRKRSIFDQLDKLKLPSIGRPTTRADVDCAIEQETRASKSRRR